MVNKDIWLNIQFLGSQSITVELFCMHIHLYINQWSEISQSYFDNFGCSYSLLLNSHTWILLKLFVNTFHFDLVYT